ncbi:MAG: ABC transporter permease [Muribaculaceae bacterium]|nr:ABC transporter permease [Muribaculaceae bacterium]
MLALRIALRYLRAKKSHNAVNVISLISIGGVAVATAAIVIVLSVFNGFNDLAASHLSAIDPELKVQPVQGKVFAGADSLADVLAALPEIAAAAPSLEERALLVGQAGQMPVVLKGVSPERYPAVVAFNTTIIDGTTVGPEALDAAPTPPLYIAVGVAVETGLRPAPDTGASLFVPRRQGRLNPANPAAAYRRADFTVAGVFRIEQPEYDADHVVLPIDEARRLLDYSAAEASAIELRIAPGVDAAGAAAAVEAALPDANFRILTRLQQQEAAFRMIAIEKWMTFVMLIAILLIAAFNILSTLSLLVIEKRDDAATLRALGAPASMVASVFRWEGALITCSGGLLGIILGSLLVLGQQTFGWIKLAGDPALLSTAVYPVRLAPWPDLALVALAVALIAAAVAAASRLFTKKL